MRIGREDKYPRDISTNVTKFGQRPLCLGIHARAATFLLPHRSPNSITDSHDSRRKNTSKKIGVKTCTPFAVYAGWHECASTPNTEYRNALDESSAPFLQSQNGTQRPIKAFI